MVKSLVDACLLKIEENISSIKRLGRKLSRKHKEILIERLCWHRRFTPHNVSTIARHLFVPGLLRLNLSHSDQVDDKLLEVLAECGCYPEYITIRNCPKVTGKGICYIARMTKRAEKITLQDLRSIDSSSLVDFGSPFISHLILEGCSQITDVGLIAVLKKCTNVRVLNISWLHQLTDESITVLAKKLNFKLEELDAAGLNLLTCASTIALAQHCPSLRRANFEACSSLNGCGLVEMATNCKLQELNLSHCCHISDDMVQEIMSQSRFRCTVIRLNMHGVYLSQDAFDMTVTLPHLRVLELFDTERVNDTALRRICLAVGSRLTELSISHCSLLTEKACESIGKLCCMLEKLSFVDLPKLTGAGLKQLLEDHSRAHRLHYLQVTGCEKFDIGIIRLSATKCCSLQTLLLEALNGVNDDIVFSIAHNLPKLQRLSLRNCRFTDAGICEVAKHCGKLRMLALDGNCSLTDKGVLALAENCPCLSELYLLGSDRVSQHAVQHVVSTCINCVHRDAPSTLSEELVVKDLDSGRYVRLDELLQGRHATLSLQSP